MNFSGKAAKIFFDHSDRPRRLEKLAKIPADLYPYKSGKDTIRTAIGDMRNVNHTFLVDGGRWLLKGTWREVNQEPMPVTGRILVSCGQDDWFSMAAKITFPDQEKPELVLQSRGKLELDEQVFTYVLQHSLFGRLEGEGWITPHAIVQHFILLGDANRCTGFEHYWQLDANHYTLLSGIHNSHRLKHLLEATLERV